jgi:hypothetical protein
MLELLDAEDDPVDLDVVAVLELVGAYDGESALSRAKSQYGYGLTIAAEPTAVIGHVGASRRGRAPSRDDLMTISGGVCAGNRGHEPLVLDGTQDLLDLLILRVKPRPILEVILYHLQALSLLVTR